jgi:predicted RNA-binding protein YlxR (DUF448 family)
MQSREKQFLIRIAGYEGQLTLDPAGRAKGRGVYLCKDSRDCWQKADKRKAIERNFDMPVSAEMKAEIFCQLEELTDGE